MKTAFWLYFFMFIAFFDLHAQYPILTPYAISLGAVPTFIGWMMGVHSLTHLPGNVLAGRGVDRHGSRRYLVFSLVSAGLVLILQAYVTNPWQLLVLRAISGFVLAFLSPACLALLASLASNPFQQGKLMAGHGVTHTLASVLSPAVGSFLVAQVGFTWTFQSLGLLLIAAGFIAFAALRETKVKLPVKASETINNHSAHSLQLGQIHLPIRYLLLPLAVACAQGILFFELPMHAGGVSGMLHTGIYFSILSSGALVTLSMMFLNRYSPQLRALLGTLGMALCFFALALPNKVPIEVSLFALGMTKGIVYPSISSLFIELSGGERLGTVFSYQSIATSIGSFLGPILAGQLHNTFSPYFLAFIFLMVLIIVLPTQRQNPLLPVIVEQPPSRTL